MENTSYLFFSHKVVHFILCGYDEYNKLTLQMIVHVCLHENGNACQAGICKLGIYIKTKQILFEICITVFLVFKV